MQQVYPTSIAYNVKNIYTRTQPEKKTSLFVSNTQTSLFASKQVSSTNNSYYHTIKQIYLASRFQIRPLP